MVDVLGAVARLEPNWSALPADLPPALRTLLQSCLTKDRRQRVADISTALFVLTKGAALASGPHDVDQAQREAAAQTAAAVSEARRGLTSSGRRRVLFVGAVALAVGASLAVAGTWWVLRRPALTENAVVSFEIAPQEGQTLGAPANGSHLAVSPDGRRIALVMATTRVGAGSVSQLWVRDLDKVAARLLPGTDGAGSPIWSPDGQWLAFTANGELKKISLSGGPPIRLCTVTTSFRGGTWNADDVIVFGSFNGPLQRVSAAGGTPSPVSVLGEGERAHGWPAFLPDGQRYLYGVSPGSADEFSIYIGSLGAAARTKLLVADAANVVYADGRLLFLRDETLMAQSFDLSSATLRGEPAPVGEDVRLTGGTLPVAAVSASATGALVYEPGGSAGRSRLIWHDRTGRQLGSLGTEATHADVEISPDGTQVATTIRDAARRDTDIWLYDVARGIPTRLTSDPGNDFQPVWSPDGTQIMFESTRGGTQDLYQITPNRREQETLLWKDRTAKFTNGWTPDGQFFVTTVSGAVSGVPGNDILMWPFSGPGDRKPVPLLQTKFSEGWAKVSPDGQWITYRSDETGAFELYVSAFPKMDRTRRVSTAGANWPRWRADGREIFYVAPDNMLMAMPVARREDELEVGAASPLFRVPPKPVVVAASSFWRYDVAADGQRFLVDVPVEQRASPLRVVLNWQESLKRLVPTR
jgi:Tol biopolymer transport system component